MPISLDPVAGTNDGVSPEMLMVRTVGIGGLAFGGLLALLGLMFEWGIPLVGGIIIAIVGAIAFLVGFLATSTGRAVPDWENYMALLSAAVAVVGLLGGGLWLLGTSVDDERAGADGLVMAGNDPRANRVAADDAPRIGQQNVHLGSERTPEEEAAYRNYARYMLGDSRTPDVTGGGYALELRNPQLTPNDEAASGYAVSASVSNRTSTRCLYATVIALLVDSMDRPVGRGSLVCREIPGNSGMAVVIPLDSLEDPSLVRNIRLATQSVRWAQ